jgi:hypothetical protein
VAFAAEEPRGAVPLDSGSQPAAETSSRAARLKRLINSIGAVNLGSELALVGINVLLDQRK